MVNQRKKIKKMAPTMAHLTMYAVSLYHQLCLTWPFSSCGDSPDTNCLFLSIAVSIISIILLASRPMPARTIALIVEVRPSRKAADSVEHALPLPRWPGGSGHAASFVIEEVWIIEGISIGKQLAIVKSESYRREKLRHLHGSA